MLLLLVSAVSSAAGRGKLASRAHRYIEPDSATASILDVDNNPLIFPGGFKAITAFEKKLENLLRTRKGRINIWHVGGSHVQADMLSHRLRNHFTGLTGITGTRGMLFPFSMANTNYGNDHRLSYTGSWSTSRNISADPSLPLGITGIAAATSDRRATVSLTLNVKGSLTWKFNALRVLCENRAPADSLTVTVTDNAGNEWPLEAEAGGFYAGNLPWLTSCTIVIDNPTGARFVLHGIEPVNTTEGTINYYSSGINGAATASWLRCERLDQDLMRLKPDLVVMGIGINDAAVPSSKFDRETFESRYRRIIAKVRKANPKALILFITNNDTFYKGMPNTNAVTVREAFVNLAKEYDGCVWDCFGVMGGMGSSTRWRSAGLMAKDRIHFSRAGYELLADLMFESIITDFIDNDE